MKSILKKVAGLAVTAALALGIMGCTVNVNTHEHTFATTYTCNETHHWHAATCEHTTEVKDKAEHTFGEWTSNDDATTWADGTRSRTCTACSYKETVTDEGSKLPDYSISVVGDFILKDGSILSKDSTPESGTVAAVIVRAAADGKPALGVGIVHNRNGLAWCTSSAAGYSKNITDLQGDQTSGYMDGSGGWEILKTACSDAGEHPEYYPAWNYSLTYATTNGLTGDLADGWYLPTVAELYTIYQNKAAVDVSLSKAGGTQFGTSWYWSCCQKPYDVNYARGLYFGNGDMGIASKSIDSGYVCSVRAFN